MDYPGLEGFLGTRASFMLDFVCVAMAAILPAMGWSIRLASKRRNYALHKYLQLGLATALLAAVALFELDMRINGWRERALESPYYSSAAWDAVDVSLAIHLVCSISAFALWVVVVLGALRFLPNPPTPNTHSATHRRLGKLAAISLTLTAITGWAFYYLAFVAKG